MVLIGDREFRIAVRSARTRVKGVLAGLGGDLCMVKYIAQDGDVKPGDVFVTAGLDGIFPPDRFVGICTNSSNETGELHRWIEIRPACTASRVENVAILLPPAATEPEGR